MPVLAKVGVRIISSCEYRAQRTVSSRAHASELSNEHNRPLQEKKKRGTLSAPDAGGGWVYVQREHTNTETEVKN